MSRAVTVKLADFAPAESLGTEALPLAAVAEDVAVGIWLCGTEPGKRQAVRMISVRLGGRVNPQDLSPDEAEYVARVIETAAACYRARYVNGAAAAPGVAE